MACVQDNDANYLGCSNQRGSIYPGYTEMRDLRTNYHKQINWCIAFIFRVLILKVYKDQNFPSN